MSHQSKNTPKANKAAPQEAARFALRNSHVDGTTYRIRGAIPRATTQQPTRGNLHDSPERSLKGHTMQRVLIATAAAFLALCAEGTILQAADKGRVATPEQVMADPIKHSLSGCYVEASAAGTFLKAAREPVVGIGGGCDVILANLLIGGGIRADWSDPSNTGSIFAKMGVSINNGAVIYGLAEWRVPDWKPAQAGQLAIGGGAELGLHIINPALSLFGEGTFAASKFGATTKDDVVTRLGLRYRF